MCSSDLERAQYQQRLFEDVLPATPLKLDPVNAIAEEQIDFAASIREGREPVVTGAQALRALRVAEQIVTAARVSAGITPSPVSLKPAA